MPIRAWFPTFIYCEPLLTRGAERFNAELLRECHQIRDFDRAGQKWSATNYPGGYTSYGSMTKLHKMSSTFAELERRITRHARRYARHLEFDLRNLQSSAVARVEHFDDVCVLPCNDFGAQEPGSLEEIQSFCSTTYGVNFPILAKVPISGAPFDTLIQTEPSGPVAWNFEKFLVGRDGRVLARFSPSTSPEDPSVLLKIEQALAAR